MSVFSSVSSNSLLACFLPQVVWQPFDFERTSEISGFFVCSGPLLFLLWTLIFMVYRGMHLLSCSDADLLDEDENGHARILCAMCRGEGVTVLLPCNHACLCRLCFRALCEASRTPQLSEPVPVWRRGCVCVYIIMYICGSGCRGYCGYLYECTHICLSVCLCLCVCVYIYSCTCICVNGCRGYCGYLYECTHTCLSVCLCLCVSVYIYTCTCICVNGCRGYGGGGWDPSPLP